MNLIILGAPGAGKGTQAIRLCKDLNLVHISTGDLLREALKGNSKPALKAKKYMDNGKLVPDELVTEFLKIRLSKPDIKNGFISDGYPRNLNQAKLFEVLLDSYNIKIDNVIYLDACEDTLIQRLSGRRVCSNCNANFHITNMPPKIDSKCDFCNQDLYQRDDDKPETIKKRLEVYKEQTHSLIDYYKEKGLLVKFIADSQADTVYKEVLNFLKNDSAKV